MIRACDTNTPYFGEVYKNIDSMMDRIKEIIKANHSDPFEVFDHEVKDIVTMR